MHCTLWPKRCGFHTLGRDIKVNILGTHTWAETQKLKVHSLCSRTHTGQRHKSSHFGGLRRAGRDGESSIHLVCLRTGGWWTLQRVCPRSVLAHENYRWELCNFRIASAPPAFFDTLPSNSTYWMFHLIISSACFPPQGWNICQCHMRRPLDLLRLLSFIHKSSQS